jgi:hypothetical protein
MGLILAALAGAGGQAADYADKSIAQDQRLQAMTTESDLATQRAEALEQFKVDMSNSQRQQMVQRVQGAAGDIADQKMAPMVAQEQAGITDPSSWTPEQQAAVDQSNGITRQGIVQQALQDGSAGLASGDIAPEKAMENTSKLQINQIKVDNLLERAQDRNQTLQDIAAVRADAMRYGYELRLRAAEEKRLSGKIDTATGRMLITSEDANIKASTNQMQMLSRELENVPRLVGGKPNPKIDDINSQIQSLREDIKASQANKAAYLNSMGIVGAGSAGGSGTGPTVGGAPYPDGTKLTGPGGAPYIVKNGQPVPLQ